MVPIDDERVAVKNGGTRPAETQPGLHVAEVTLPFLVAVEVEAVDAV